MGDQGDAIDIRGSAKDRLGRQRPLAIVSAQGPLTGVKRTPKTLEILNSDFRFRPQALVIGRVFRDLDPSTMVVHTIRGESHDLLCRTRRLTTNGQYLHHR